MRALARLWRSHRLLLVAAVVAFALTLFFAARVVVFTRHWQEPARRDQAIAGWMTPRYIAYSWDVPPEVVAEGLGVERPRTGRPPTLDSIAAEEGVTVGELAARVEAAIARYRAGQQ